MQLKLLGTLSALALSTALTFQSAKAATFDFVAEAAGNEHGSLSEAFTDGTVTVTASARNLADTVDYLAYLDDLSGGEPGGLGVCKTTGAGTECDPSEDDNIGLNEVITLVFNSPVTITSIEFSNGTHLDNYAGNFGVAIDSNPTTVAGFTQFATTAVFNTPLFGTTFQFISNATISGLTQNENLLYISKLTATAVPEPMTLGLLSLGLGLAGFRGSRKRA